MTVEAVLFGMIRGVICGAGLSEELKNACTEDMLARVYKLAARHDLAHIVGQAVGRLGLPEGDVVKKAKDAAMTAFMRGMSLERVLAESCEVLSQAGIDHIPLKGSVLRQYYPESWLRTSCDIDILVKPESLSRAVACLQDELGYVAGKQGRHDIALRTPGGIALELHFDLVEEGRANEACQILRTVWDSAKPTKTGALQMDEALFYFYHIAHMAKHFETGGCGIRPFIDLWLLERGGQEGRQTTPPGPAGHPPHKCGGQERTVEDAGPYKELLERGGLLAFAQAVRKLSRVWFGGEAPDELTQRLEAFLLHGGVYGSADNRVSLQQQGRGGRLGYLRSRVFAPYEKLKSYYPVLEKHRWLTPVMQVRRWGMLLRPSVARMVKKELAANSARKDSDGDLMQALGLEDGRW